MGDFEYCVNNYPTHLMQNDIHISSKQNMANEFNNFFLLILVLI